MFPASLAVSGGEALVAAITHICRYVGGSACFLRPNNVVHYSGARMAPWSCTARQSSQRPGGSWTFRSGSNDKCVLPTHNARRSMETERDCRSVTRIGILAVPVTFLHHHFVTCAMVTFVVWCLWWRTALVMARLSTCAVMVFTCVTSHVKTVLRM